VFYFFALILLWLSWKSFRSGIEYLRFFEKEIAKPIADFTPFCSIIAPCKGLDHELYENLSALLAQDYPNYEVIFVLEDRNDPAISVIEKAVRESASVSASNATTKILFSERSEDTAQKVHKLRIGSSHISTEAQVLVFVDSDVRVNSRWLGFLVAPLADKRVGCATGYRWFIASRGFASHLRSVWNASIASALGADTAKNFCWGGSLAIRREIFERLEISTRWRGTLSDDFTVMRVLNESHLPIVFVPQCLNAQTGNCTFSELLEFTTRQMKITRVYAPHLWRASLIGSLLFSLTFWIGIVLLFFLPFAEMDFAITLILLAAIFIFGLGKAYLRFKAVKLVLDDHGESFRKSLGAHLLLWTITPLIYFYNSFAALFSRKLVWRGTEYELISPTETKIIRSDSVA